MNKQSRKSNVWINTKVGDQRIYLLSIIFNYHHDSTIRMTLLIGFGYHHHIMTTERIFLIII